MAVPPPAALEITIWRPGEVSFDDGSGGCETYQLPLTSVTGLAGWMFEEGFGNCLPGGGGENTFHSFESKRALEPPIQLVPGAQPTGFKRQRRVCDQITPSHNSLNCTSAVAHLILA